MWATQLEEALWLGSGMPWPCLAGLKGLAGRPTYIEAHIGCKVMPSGRDIGIVNIRLLAASLVQKGGAHLVSVHKQTCANV